MLHSLSPEDLLPGSKPWILVDKVLQSDEAARISTIKLISLSDYFLQGHFKSYSIYPGVLLIEGIRQSLHLLLKSGCSSKNNNVELTNMQVRFLMPVLPGDVIEYVVHIQELQDVKKDDFFDVFAAGTVENKPIITFKAKCRNWK